MSKKSLSNGVSIKVENRSGFDKSFFNCLTAPVGSLVPLVKQLMIPNSSGHCRVKISAQLPPLASDAFLRTHLKLESFFVPMRICYGGFESFFCGREVYDSKEGLFTRAKLPRLAIAAFDSTEIVEDYTAVKVRAYLSKFGASSLADYFGIYVPDFATGPGADNPNFHSNVKADLDYTDDDYSMSWECFNIFPWLAYQLIYDEYYRNKFVQRPLFSPPNTQPGQGGTLEYSKGGAWNLPFVSAAGSILNVCAYAKDELVNSSQSAWIDSALLNGDLCQLRQRNYGDDYFTAATPNAQEGNAATVDTSGGSFTINALRLQNAMAEFKDVNNYASPDYIQTLAARYGASLKAGIAQKPIFLGSADFPMYTSGVEQTAQGNDLNVETRNPFFTVGARYGRAHAEGTEFVCDFNVDEPGYFMVLASLVPEAQYYQGTARDNMLFNDDGSLVDLPTGLLEHIGNDPVLSIELNNEVSRSQVFGYVQRYLWHKLGNRNQVHGLLRGDQNMRSFAVQRSLISDQAELNSGFLQVSPYDLDNVTAGEYDISDYGVMIDSSIDLFVSEPLSESAIPALANPAKEHGRSVYVKTGGSKLA